MMHSANGGQPVPRGDYGRGKHWSKRRIWQAQVVWLAQLAKSERLTTYQGAKPSKTVAKERPFPQAPLPKYVSRCHLATGVWVKAG